MKRALAGFGVAIAMVLAACVAAQAQDSGPQLTLRTAGGQTVFRIGERIPLEMVFTGPGNGRYQVEMGSAERRPGFTLEDVKVSPEGGWGDPLKIYIESLPGFGGDYLSSDVPLSAKPEMIPTDLNEWVRFDEPGKYQIVVTTSRVADLTARRPIMPPQSGLVLTSNPIEIQIVPATAAWQKAKLAEIEAVLAKPMKENSPLSPEQGEAMADLRALGTAGAAALMAKHLRDDDALMYDCSYGLMGLREAVRPAALDDLNAEMDDPQFPISRWFLDTMAVLEISDGPPVVMRAQRQQYLDQAWQAAFESLDSKQGKARAATVNTLLNSGHRGETPQQKSEIGRVLAASLTDLPIQQQAAVLSYNWDLIRSNVSLSELQNLATTPLTNPESNDADNFAKRDLKSAALRRWYELDPVGAQQEILREIGTSNPELTAQSLSFLPKEKLPQFEQIWAERFATTDDALYAGLLAKFGEGDAVGHVESQAQTKIGKWGCDPQNAALAYIAEFDSGNALPLIEQAIHARGKDQTMCYRSMFQGIAEYATAPVLTKAAIDAVSDPDREVVEDALIYLMDYGDASAKEAILSRYAAWTAQWSGRADELEAQSPGEHSPLQEAHWQDIGLAQNLVQALLASQGWIATPQLVARVLAGCVGKQVCRLANSIADQVKHRPYEVELSPMPDGNTTFSIEQYHIKSLELFDQKVAQFPKGTRFELIPWMNADSDGRKLQDSVKAIIAKHGMLLVPAHASFTTQ